MNDERFMINGCCSDCVLSDPTWKAPLFLNISGHPDWQCIFIYHLPHMLQSTIFKPAEYVTVTAVFILLSVFMLCCSNYPMSQHSKDRRMFSAVSVCLCVCMFVNTITSERVNIGWWNLGIGAMHALYKNIGRVRIWGHSPAQVVQFHFASTKLVNCYCCITFISLLVINYSHEFELVSSTNYGWSPFIWISVQY